MSKGRVITQALFVSTEALSVALGHEKQSRKKDRPDMIPVHGMIMRAVGLLQGRRRDARYRVCNIQRIWWLGKENES